MKDLNQNLLRYNQREELKAEIASYDAQLPHAKGDDAALIRNRRIRTQKQLETQSPEPLTGKEKDKLALLEKKLREKITHNMPTEEVMRKNPAGAVDWHQRWEKANKKLVRMWKSCRIQLNPDSSDKDLANIDRYRPSGQTDRMRTDAQIPGLMSYGNIPEELWPFPEPQNTALAQVQRHYDENVAENDVDTAIGTMEKLETESDSKAGYGPSGTLTLEEYTVLQGRLQAARDAKAKKAAEARQVDDAMGVEVVENVLI